MTGTDAKQLSPKQKKSINEQPTAALKAKKRSEYMAQNAGRDNNPFLRELSARNFLANMPKAGNKANKAPTARRAAPAPRVPRAAPKSSPGRQQHANHLSPQMAAMHAMRIWDPEIKKDTYHTATSVGRITHAPMLAKFTVTLPASTTDPAGTVYDTIVVMCPNPSAQAAYIWRKKVELGPPSRTFISVDPVYFNNMLPRASSPIATGWNGITAVPGSGGVQDYTYGTGDLPDQLRVARQSLHVQCGTNSFKRFGNVFVRRFSVPMINEAVEPFDGTIWGGTPPTNQVFLWQGVNEANFNDVVARMLKIDEITQRYTANDLVNNNSISCIPLDQAKYSEFKAANPKFNADKGPYGPNSPAFYSPDVGDCQHPVVGNGFWAPCNADVQLNIPLVQNTPGPQTPGAGNTYTSAFKSIMNPTMSTIAVYLQNVPDNDQRYSFEVYADIQARFPPGLLNAGGKSAPTAPMATLNRERDIGEAAGSHLTACGM